MQVQGWVRVFAILLILISVFQLHFTWVVKNHEQKMEKKARAWVDANYSGADTEVKETEYKKRLRRLFDSTRETVVTYGPSGSISYQKAKEVADWIKSGHNTKFSCAGRCDADEVGTETKSLITLWCVHYHYDNTNRPSSIKDCPNIRTLWK